MVSSRCTILLALLGLAFTLASAIRTPEAVQGERLASIGGEARLEELADTASRIAGSQRHLLAGLSLERWLFGKPAPAKKKGKKTKKEEPEEEKEEEATEEEDGGDEKEEKEEGGDKEGGAEEKAKPAAAGKFAAGAAGVEPTKLTDNKGVEFAEGSLSAMVAAKFGPGQFVHHNTPGSCEDLKAKSDHCRSRAKNKNAKRGCRGMQMASTKCYEARVDTMIAPVV
mmetsp:Transcript_3193/g.5436  ORF Transcript_3193/g.5436 Transcript_3193/m.5436 type:complete len:226 (-) Transcript_3193:831-1508(-)|eukprot:CAMPEP_0198208340 /NCGR_PEP_ID=MMETSP1445-20131203/11713_1 /TAXON_ID=36898 /ORGANISM="Pyramimonas sp., Strain CCMP2087" /LENGTH=225 /DNA_ID=CAMNT_0043881701 /DNA_START=157 /DNA_END=834 /DNA_ORIENTATION=+